MKKIIAILLVSLIGYSASSQKISDQTLSKAVDNICGCIMPKLNKLHPQLIKMIETMAAKDEETAQNDLSNWFSTASKEEQDRVGKDIKYMDSMGVDIDYCMKKAAEKFPDIDKEGLSDTLVDRMLLILDNKKDCKILAALIRLGKKMEEE